MSYCLLLYVNVVVFPRDRCAICYSYQFYLIFYVISKLAQYYVHYHYYFYACKNNARPDPLELAALPEVASHVTSDVTRFTLHLAPLRALFFRSRAKLFFLTRLGPLRAIMFSLQGISLFSRTSSAASGIDRFGQLPLQAFSFSVQRKPRCKPRTDLGQG